MDETHSPPLALDQLPGHLIRRLHQIAVGIFLDESRQFDLTPVQFAALDAICARPGLDQIGLSGAIAFDRTTIGGVVERLEAKGLIDRRVGQADRRTRELYITEQGRQLLDAITPAVLRTQERILYPLAPEERRQVLILLDKLVSQNNPFSRSPIKGD
ncbi:MarR family transcriptional regulator [Paramagnetospirillum kuznetsovii]|uniref:MarR family transcriptional regulator n=1 Tax=Paramagnetospirillum kuznetsovii TaxID=2053833 RepID=A0A364NWI2_9PROT|nr:MarR family winged helix-turn-helix transcriptional regulator [Paramagnetospirillum kuznetsovii]RAU21438.1 MarR family transcriptional regulator [Paramagnetospirillum kuznetsovii]